MGHLSPYEEKLAYFRQPRCRKCYYILEGLERGVCPECATPFDLDDRSTITHRYPFVWWKFWLPSFVVALVLGCLLIIGLATLGLTGAGLWIGVPFALGTLVGYGNKLRILATICLVLAVTASILFTLYSLSVAGLFCGVVLAGIFFGPILLGGLVGLALRSSLKHATWFEQRDWLVPILILAIPVVWSVIEGRPANTLPIETVRTSRVIPVTPRAAWDSLMTYEEVTHAPPLLLRLELPQPLRVEGDLDAVGASRKCVYTDGFLVKRVVERTPESSLVFEVTEQAIETHDSVTLIDGGFAFEPHPSGTTVTLTTRYRPHLAPRFIWRPVEALVVRTLHAHVIEGIRIEAESSNAVARAPVR